MQLKLIIVAIGLFLIEGWLRLRIYKHLQNHHGEGTENRISFASAFKLQFEKPHKPLNDRSVDDWVAMIIWINVIYIILLASWAVMLILDKV